jgi:hypothetical protein
MLKTTTKSKQGIIDHLGPKTTVIINGNENQIELDFHWEVAVQERVTPALIDEWQHTLKLAASYIPDGTKNHLSIGGGGDSQLGQLIPSTVQNWIVINPNILELRAIHNPKKLKTILIRGIGEDIPLRNNTIDSIDILGTIDHVVSPNTVLSEAFRVAKTGATLIMTVTNTESWYKKLFKVLKLAIPNKHSHAHEFTTEILESTLKQNGWIVKQIKTSYFLRLPVQLEKRFKSKQIRKFRNYVSNKLLPNVFGRDNGGIIICLAESNK